MLTVEAQASEGVELPLSAAEIEDAVKAVLRAEGVEVAELSIGLVSDAEIAALNVQYLEHDGPTDVISFPLHLSGGSPLGDVYIGVEQARRQAGDAGVEPREELLRLAIHGTLHILGYEHPDGDARDQSPMYLRQEELLDSFLATKRGTE